MHDRNGIYCTFVNVYIDKALKTNHTGKLNLEIILYGLILSWTGTSQADGLMSLPGIF